MSPIHFCTRFWLTITIPALFAGCKKEEVSYYEIPAETPRVTVNANETTETRNAPPLADPANSTLPDGHPPFAGRPDNAAGGMMPGMANTAPTGGPTSSPLANWTLPEGWTSGRASSMRIGSFAASDDAGNTADISITAFPGDVGGLAANVNRWRSQIALPPLPPDQIATTELQTDHLTFTLVDLRNPDHPSGPQSLLAALNFHDGKTWFIKMMGPSPIVLAQAEAFNAFLKSFSYTAY